MIKSGTQCKVVESHSQWCLYLTLFLLKLIKLGITILHVFCGVYIIMIVYELAHTKHVLLHWIFQKALGVIVRPDSATEDTTTFHSRPCTMHLQIPKRVLVAQHRGCIQNALMQGIRAFMLDVHITSSGNILLCHVSCAMGSATVSGTLEIFRQFIVQNPREIVTIFWEFGYDMRSDPNSHDDDKIELRHQLKLAMHKSNLTAFVYAHHTMYFVQWPTLQEMIGMDKRLVVFTDSRYHIRNSWETSIQNTIQTSFQLSDINALKTGCPMSGFRLSRTLVVVNHFDTLGALGINGISTNILASVFHIFRETNLAVYERLGSVSFIYRS